MASTILSRTFSSVVDKRIVLSNSNFARQWDSSIGTSWSRIRIGCRISIRDSGANLTGTPEFILGICSGTSNIYQDATTTHWTGLRTIDPTWTRTAGPPAWYNMATATSNPVAAKKVGTTKTNSATTAWLGIHAADATTENRSALFVDITKGSPNFSFNFIAKDTGGAGDDSLASFYAFLQNPSQTVTDWTNHKSSITGGGAFSLAIDEATNGFFDSVNIGWNRTTPEIEISDLVVVRFS